MKVCKLICFSIFNDNGVLDERLHSAIVAQADKNCIISLFKAHFASGISHNPAIGLLS